MTTTTNTLRRVWEPLQIRNVTFKNRILQPAHSSQHGERTGHLISDRQIAYFRERAKGGVALSITESVAAAKSQVGSFHNIVDVSNKRVLPMLTKLADAVHEHDGRIMAQLAGVGIHDQGRMFVDEWKPIYGASQITSLVHNESPLIMGQEEIRELTAGFGQSAVNCQKAGMDGVEVHGAHSYLLGQWLSPTYNTRTDAYGGSVAKRCQLVIECAEQIRERVGADFVVGVRLSWDEFLGEEGGITPEQSEEQCGVLADTGLFDFFNISAGGYHTLNRALPSMEGPEPDAWLVPFSKRAKEIVGERAKVFVVGKIRDLHQAEAILESGSADMVAMARQLLADPFTVEKTREGREHEIIRCNGNNECAGRLFEHREVICALNPVSGRESYWGDGTRQAVADGDARKVVVVGAGPAGMKAAAVAASRGHEVRLIERGEELGGHLALLKQLPGLRDWAIAIDNLRREMANAGVEVHLGEAADAASLAREKADVIVVATGSSYEATGQSGYRPGRASIPGAELDHVLDVKTAATRALEDPGALGHSVMILDESGSYLVFGLAELLIDAGVKVEVLTPRLFAGEKLYRTTDMFYMFPRLKAKGVVITAQHFVEAIRACEVDVYDNWKGPEAIETRSGVDTVVMALLRLADDDLYNTLNGNGGASEIIRIGDAVAPRDVTAAIYEGEKVGRAL